MLRIQGPVVADWQDLFAQSWTRQHNTQPLPLRNDTEAFTGHTQTGRLTVNAPTRMEIKRSLLVQLNQAEQRIWIATAYFIPSWKIRRRLRKAARQGVDVRLLLPGKHTDHPAIRHAGRRYYTQLLRNGVRIFEYQPRFVHAKILLCDDWVSIGSSNIDRWNLRWNLEANQEVRDPLLATQVQDLFERDFSDSNEMHYRNWRKRPWYRRWQENFWSLIARWLERFSQR
jgi:phosphatidylserine/phosphatidylglycerophosphate/cardiolipin synthase-like enzyme